MRAFIVLALVATVCCDIGYNYNAGSGSPSSGGIGGLNGPAAQSSSGLGSQTHQTSDPVSTHHTAPTTYDKEFYTFTAPENEFAHQNVGLPSTNVKKHLQVVFIKTPENNGLEEAALQLATQTTEEKTAIYVLTKQADISSLARQLQDTNTHQSSKPEVHFVKYRTPQDAENAQRAIQTQYNELSGRSQSHDGGVASVLNYASQAPIAQGPAPEAPSNAYLPSSVLRLFRA